MVLCMKIKGIPNFFEIVILIRQNLIWIDVLLHGISKTAKQNTYVASLHILELIVL